MNSSSFLPTTHRVPPHSSVFYTSIAIAKPRNPSSCAIDETAGDGEAAAVRARRLAAEFRLLAEPMNRVRRLLHYADRLPPGAAAARSPENRVGGWATQVWVEAEMSEATGRLRFRADSDSEISKGFCSCLVWILDGAAAEEVLGLAMEELDCVNVGLHGKVHSRANTWHNVVVAMQRKTRALADERSGKRVEPLLSFSVSLPL